MSNRSYFIVLPILTLTATGALSQENQRQIERNVQGAGASENNTFMPRTDTSLTTWERAQFDVGGTLSLTAAFIDDASGNSRRYFSPELIGYARMNLDGAHGFFVRSRAAYREFSTGDSFDGRGDSWAEPVLDRFWYEFDSRRAGEAYGWAPNDVNFNVRIGRQFIDWASGLTYSEAMYAAKPTIEFGKRTRLEGLIGITPDHAVDFDTSRASYDRKTRRMYVGGMLTHTFEHGDEVFGYVLNMSDKNSDSRARVGAASGINFDRDSTYFGLGGRGTIGDNWLYTLEGVLQSGDSASDPLLGAQTVNDLTAWAGRAQFTYVFRDKNDSRAQFELLVASGDKDRRTTSDTIGGNAPNTSDHAFSSLGFGYTGLAFSPSLSNLVSLRGGAATYPWRESATFDQLQLGFDVLGSWKMSKSGGIDEPTFNNRFLGAELNLYSNWRLTSDFSLTARYGVFFAGDAIAGDKGPRHFILVGATLAF